MADVKGKLTWAGDGDLFVAETGSGHTVLIDTPRPDGTRKWPGPKELTLLSLGGCSGVNLVSLMRKMRQNVTRIEMELDADVARQDPAVFTQIHQKFIVYGKNVDPAKVKKALDYVEEKYCGVLHMLNKTATIHVSFEIVEE